MQNKIILSIQQHLQYMESILTISQKILRAAIDEDDAGLSLESNNRERLINIIEELQNKIEIRIKALPSQMIDPAMLNILKTWGNEVNQWIHAVDQIDQQILEHLESIKEKTTKEIATIFKSRQQFKGYNLNNVRK